MALGVVIPSLLIVWATTLASIPGAAAARILLFFLVLPCFFAYIGIVTARFFPRSALGSVKFFLPLAINLALYGLSFASFEEFALYYVLSSLPLFLGFTLLLLAGLSFLILANMSLSVVREAIISFVIVVLGTLPVLYTALLGYELHVRDVAGDVARWRVVASYVSSTVLVFYLHLAPMRTLYREGKL